MILDTLLNCAIYAPLHPGIDAALAFLSSPDTLHLPCGRHEIAGDKIFAIVEKGRGRGKDHSPLEVHDTYIDVQYVVSGDEWMGWAPFTDCTLDKNGFNPVKDIGFCLERPQCWLQVKPGSFAIFYPSDAHAPLAGEGEVHKIIVKVARKS